MPPKVTHHSVFRSWPNYERRFSGKLRLSIVIALCVFFPPALVTTHGKGVPVTYQCQSGITTLSLGVPVDCDIKGSETHSYGIEMSAGDYARIKVQRKGIDLIVNVSSPGSPNTTPYESPAGPQSPMSFSIIATAAGIHTVALHPIEKWVAAGNYRITLEVLGAPSSQDQKRINAERKVAEGRSKQSIDTDDSRRDALASYQQALGLWRELGDAVEEANTLQFMARTYRTFSEPDLANCVATYNQVLERRGDEDKQARAYTLLDMADALMRSKYEDAFNKYEEARQLFETINNRSGQAAALYGKGLSKARLNEMADALPYYEGALQIYTAPGSLDRHEEARTRHALGGAYDVLGQPQEAQDSFTAALQAWRETGDPGQEGNTYSSLGKLELDRGNWQVAFETYDKAFELYQSAETISPREKPALRYRRASSLYNLAYVYAALSDYKRAFDLLDQSLALREPGNKGSTYMLTCYFKALSGEPEKALEPCEKGITELQASGSKRVGEAYTAKGVAYAMLGKHNEALQLYDQSLAIQVKTNAAEAAAITQGWRGETLMALGQAEEAFDSYKRAHDFWQQKDPNGAALALIGMAKAERARNHPSEALKYVDEAIALIEPLRTNVTSEGLRTAYFSTKIDYYDLYIDLCMQLAAGDSTRLIAAFEASERERARSLIDTLAKARFEGGLKSDPELAELVSKYHNIQRGIQKARLKHEQSNDLQKERAAVELKLRTQYPHYAGLMFPQPLKAADVQKLLDDGTLLLEFALGQERSYVWAVTATELHGYKLPKRSEIEAIALQLTKHLSSGQRLRGETTAQRALRLEKEEAAYWPQATALSRTLFGQIPSLAHKKHLLIVADGQLQYLPFGALPAPDATANSADASLVKDHEITTLPSASVLSVLRETTGRVQPTKLLAVFADPVFEPDDSRIQLTRRKNVVKPLAEKAGDLAQALRDVDSIDNTGKLARLYASGREARQILDLVPRSSRLEAIGVNANREKVTSSELAHYRIVHFATHGILNETKPESSGVVLSLYDEQGRYHPDGYLNLNDIYNLKLPVDLVVLSACRTGLGRPVRGEGLIGLTRGFMYGGTRGVLASFWNVDDDATAELMKRFYQKMLKEGMTPSAALSAAQWSMSRDSQWSNPYYWAGFVLQGDTR